MLQGQPALITLSLLPPLIGMPSRLLTFYQEQQKMNKSQVSWFFYFFPISFPSRFCVFYKHVHTLKSKEIQSYFWVSEERVVPVWPAAVAVSHETLQSSKLSHTFVFELPDLRGTFSDRREEPASYSWDRKT